MSSNEHLEAIRECIRRAQYPQQIGPRKQTEERDLYYATILRHANALATELAEAEARIALIAPLVNAAIEMYLWEGSTDYPNGDLEVEKRRQSFYSAVHDLWDLHDDELDFLEGASAPDATERTHERV